MKRICWSSVVIACSWFAAMAWLYFAMITEAINSVDRALTK